MNFAEYQAAVAHRFKSNFSTVDALMVAVSGILIELDEVGRATTKANEHEELGDVLFYIAYARDVANIGLGFITHRGKIDLDKVYSELIQTLGRIHKAKRGKDLDCRFHVDYAISLAYRWVEQQGVDMESLYQANIKKVSAL